MSSISKVIGQNISDCMNQNDVSIVSLSEVAGISRQTMAKIITGESIIDSEKLSIIANYFNKPFEYFFENSHDELSFMFRANNSEENCLPSERESIKTLMDKFVEVEKFVGKKYSFIPPQYSIEAELKNRKLSPEIESLIERIAIEQREYLDIGDNVGYDLIKCFEDKGIKVIFRSMNNNALFGVSAYHDKKGCFIFINDDKNIPEERKIFSIVHEYAHLIFHRELYKNEKSISVEYSNYKTDVNEKVANVFSGYFLIPRSIISRYDYILKSGSFTWNSLYSIKQDLKVSIQSLLVALFNYGYINKEQRDNAYKLLSQKGYMKSEPHPIGYIEKNLQYMNMIKELFTKDEIGVSKVAELLDMKIIDTRKLVKDWCIDEAGLQVFI